MSFEIIVFAALSIVLILCGAICFRVFRVGVSPSLDLHAKLNHLEDCFTRLDRSIRDEFSRGREESGAASKLLREEVSSSFSSLVVSVSNATAALAQTEKMHLDAFGERLNEMKTDAAARATSFREEVQITIKNIATTISTAVANLTAAQTERLDNVTKQIASLSTVVQSDLEKLRSDNAEKLEQMRITVDEKLQGTLEKRLGASFKLVSDQLEQVFRGVGEMQALATGVGDLKKVLTNVRMRGAWGEVTLGSLLEQVMTADQYEKNVEIKPGSNQRVEYAIKLPGGDDGVGTVWLPIDAKFPHEDYERLIAASERGDADGVEIASKAIETRIRAAAADICSKYVHPPHSTDFAVLFLPTEGLFAEIIRRPGLVDALQRECRIVVTGPTVLMALLNSLRMGFRTLAIQKRSSEVWQVLAAVKSEFGKYGEVLDKVQQKLHEASDTIEKVAIRRRAIDRKLRGVEVLPEAAAIALLELNTANGFDPDPEARGTDSRPELS